MICEHSDVMVRDNRKQREKKLRLTKKVRRYQRINEFIINKYSTFEQLKENRRCYVKEKSLSLKQSYNDYKTYMRNQSFSKKHLNEVIEFENEDENSQSTNNNDGEEFPVDVPQCLEGVSHNGDGSDSFEDNTMPLEQNVVDGITYITEANTGVGNTVLQDVDNEPGVMNEIENSNDEGSDERISYQVVQDTYDVICENCHRKQSDVLLRDYRDECYTIEFRRYNSTAVKKRRKFNMLPRSFVRSSSTFICLCAQCGTHLTLHTSNANRKIYNSPGNVWPGFIWYVLSCREFQDIYGGRLWQFIPLTWRHWWLQEARSCFVDEITLFNPDSLFIDKSNEINEWNREIGVMKLGNLRDVSNKLLMPCILCPWGCTEFLHK